MSDKPQRRVVCAANRYQCKLGGAPMVFIGVRHFCPVMRQNIHPHKEYIDRQTEEQGFIDQWGVFMSREEALSVAKVAGQLNISRIKSWPENELFSEDLY
ncbi:hypothetical protein [Citrobacter amalonaticus]|uniref:hypothetical protein n=1 Tax=Citrobacter amalonaticus TaxID=35703 RepID=UPI001C952EB0|nr:hypothetical protein [Citrobacter amalonaticus]